MFNPGDEIECIDRAPAGCPVQKGDRFVCPAFIGEGATVAPDGSYLGCDCVSIGIDNPMLSRSEPGLSTYDLWPAIHFRKIQKKRTREELYSLIGIDGMVDQRAREVARLPYPKPTFLPMCPCVAHPVFTESRSENARLKASARLPDRMRMAVGVAVESLTGVSRGTDGARLAVTLTRKGTHSLSQWAGRPVGAAQRIGTAEGSGDGSSVRSDQFSWGGGVMAKRWTPEEEIAALAFIRGASSSAPPERSVGAIRQKFPDDIAFLVVEGFDRLPRDVRHTLSMPFLRMAATRPISIDDRNGAQKAIDDFRADALKHAILRGYSCPDGDEWAASVRAALFSDQSRVRA